MADGKGDIVIKKIKKGGHGAHGGAWKVAYADFVTAMMAFFLLLWLLNATEAEKLSGIADYFAPTVGVKGEMGIGFKGGKSSISEGISSDKNVNRGIIQGGTPSGPIVKVDDKIEPPTEQPEQEKVVVMINPDKGNTQDPDSRTPEQKAQDKAVTDAVEEIKRENTQLDSMLDVMSTPEGLVIQIKDSDSEPMFEKGTSTLRPKVRQALQQLVKVMEHLPNFIAISGHTSSVALSEKADYTNWELSADRANATRRFLVESGMDAEQFVRITGLSDNDPLDPLRPNHPVNNRIKITLLNDSVIPQHKQSAPDKLLIDTSSKEVKEVQKNPEEQNPEQLMKKMMKQIEEAPSQSPNVPE